MSLGKTDTTDAFDYGVIKTDLTELFYATANKLEREWPASYANVDSARVFFPVMVRVAANTYNTIFYVCADTPDDPGRRPIYSLSIPPLTRNLFEILTSLLYILEDVPKYIPLFFKTGYTERRMELDHVTKYSGAKPEWQPYIQALQAQIQKEETVYNLSKREISNPLQFIGKWPTPRKVKDRLTRDHPSSSAIPFIEYINSWLYRELSGLTHLNAPGFTDRGWPFFMEIPKQLFGDDADQRIQDHLQNFKNLQIHVAITLMLAIVSEIEMHFRYDLAKRINLLWGILNSHSDTSKDLYEFRYAGKL
jgi:hypothetical protein